MRFLLGYFLKRLPREGFKGLSVPVLAFALVVLINAIWGVRVRMESEYLDLVENHDIVFMVSDGEGTGTDDLQISDMVLERFFDPEAFWTISEFIGSLMLKTTLGIFNEPPPVGPEAEFLGLEGIEDIEYIASLSNIPWSDSNISLFPGYENFLEEYPLGAFGGPFYCLVSEGLLEYVEDSWIRIGKSLVRGPNVLERETYVLVVGTVSGFEENYIFAPWSTYRNFYYHVYVENPGNKSMDVTLLSMADDDDMRIGSLIGITGLGAVEALMPEGDARIEFFEGYDESVFASGDALAALEDNSMGELVAVVSEDFLEVARDGVLSIYVMPLTESVRNKPISAELTVVGTVIGGGEGIVYSPFWTVRGLGAEAGGGSPPLTESLSGTLSDNRELDAFKEEAMRSFSRVGVFFGEQRQAMTIFDLEYYDRTEVLLQTVFFIDIATPFVYIISVSIGFIASFLLTRRRKAEFANMRSVGVGKGRIFAGALFEQTLLCAVGVAAAIVLFYLTWGNVFIHESLIFLGCYMLGAMISAARAAGTDVLRLLREKE